MSVQNHKNFPTANASYVSNFGNKGSLSLPPGKKLIVVTCMDARLDPAAYLDLKEGDAHVIRNAGGSAKEALRSIIISQKLLATEEIAVIHHTGCGMLTFTDDQLKSKLKSEHPDAAQHIDSYDFLTFGDLEQSVRDDVQLLKSNPLVNHDGQITGWVYEVETGKASSLY